MSDIRIVAQQTDVGRVGGGQGVSVSGTRDGALFTAPWYQALVMEGAGYGAEFGATSLGATDPATFGAGGVDLDEFDMLQTVLAGFTVIPLYFHAIYEAIGTIAAVDTFYVWGSGGIVGANSVAVTAHNLRADLATTGNTTIVTAGDDGGTVITVGGAIYRYGGTHLTGSTGNNNRVDQEWSVATAGFTPLVISKTGAVKQLAAFLSAQASTGFIHSQWAELPSSVFA